jgi:hypothetical protein
MKKPLLYDSQELTLEEEALRSELRAWCRGKLMSGSRSVPLQAALRIVGEQMSDPPGNGIVEPDWRRYNKRRVR